MSFLSYEASTRVSKKNKLLKLSKIIDWEKISKHLTGLYAFEINGQGGQKPYDSVKMFKAILLGQWYSLSDPELEEALQVRLDFMIFTELEEKVPDETTLCRFRNRLTDKGLYEILFLEINSQLEKHGLKVKNCEGAILDATIIESAARPKKVVENIAQDRNEPETQESEVKVNYSKDSDAAWLKKGKKYHYGYKGFVTTDSEDGYITNIHVTPANKSEVKNLKASIPKNKIKRLFADKGYASKENRKLLKSKQIKDAIMSKAFKNKPLSGWEKLRNKLISKKRFLVEQGFGTLKRRFRFSKATYISKQKVKTQFTLKAICFNLLKAVNKVELA